MEGEDVHDAGEEAQTVHVRVPSGSVRQVKKGDRPLAQVARDAV
jgi:hypothetical protein